MNRITATLWVLHVYWLWASIGSTPGLAQSGELQLNLLLEPDQILDWSREFPVVLAKQIPATITLGRLQGENTVIGILGIAGLENRLVLHGIETDQMFNLHEWVDNSIRSGSLELSLRHGELTGFWFNRDKSIRLSIDTEIKGLPQEIRQYQHAESVFHTQFRENTERLIASSFIDHETWDHRTPQNVRCLDLTINHRATEFCRTAHLDLYAYHKVDLVRLLHGLVPQIPHDEIFNRQISDWLEEWADEVFQEPDIDVEEHRWSHQQAIWFTPDFIADDLVSGLLSIQFSGNQFIHSHSIVYDRNKKQFYTPRDFFRNHTPWGDNFQELARKSIYAVHQEMIDIFPEVFERIRFHMTLNPQGVLISSDYTPYFGRLEVQLNYEDYQQDLQRFAPFRKLIHQ